MDVIEVDERDSTWEDPRPRFRVYVQRPEGEVFATDTTELLEADVLQAVDWAQRRAAEHEGALWSLALVSDDRRGLRGLTWLVGSDANDPPEDGLDVDRRARMRARRSDPVVVPPRDRAPADD
ncbi:MULTISPECIES: hypothetical protein [unclassified Curtobacterium]|uniref:hypothetical protein n=1 Tax=unclassified Curtobacterium TaxID=257496 RepID=UPI003A7FB761